MTKEKKIKKVKKLKIKKEKILEKKQEKINYNQARIATGIKNFDSLIEGGFEKNSTNLVVGSSGSGKTIFAVEFLIDGIKKGEKCLYITFEEGKNEFYSNMKDFGWDLAKYEKDEKFFFLEYTPEKVRTMLEEGGGTIESIVLTKNIKRIVIDSITSFELLFEKELEKRESALALFNMISKWECTSLLTYEGAPSPGKEVSSRILDFESDSIIVLYFVREKKQRKRYLEVLKMRGTKHSMSIYPFTIERTGIFVGNKTYEGILN